MRALLEKLVDGEWYPEGTYSTPGTLANAAYYLGDSPLVKQVRAKDTEPQTVTLEALLNGRWVKHGSYDIANLTPMVRAVMKLSENPNVADFRVKNY